jgi:putative sigma-54 modulation protein
MRIDFKFRHMDPSEELTAYTSDHLHRLEKYDQRPTRIELTFTHEGAGQRVDAHVRGKNLEIHAHHSADDFFTAVDHVLEKVERQLEKKKAKLKSHKKVTPKVS